MKYIGIPDHLERPASTRIRDAQAQSMFCKWAPFSIPCSAFRSALGSTRIICVLSPHLTLSVFSTHHHFLLFPHTPPTSSLHTALIEASSSLERRTASPPAVRLEQQCAELRKKRDELAPQVARMSEDKQAREQHVKSLAERQAGIGQRKTAEAERLAKEIEHIR